jgi:hypothetical protein
MVFDMTNDLLPFPLTPRTVHLCVDMQRIFSSEGPWATPWMERVLRWSWRSANGFPSVRYSRDSLRHNMPKICPGIGVSITKSGGDDPRTTRRPAPPAHAGPCQAGAAGHRDRQDEVFRFFEPFLLQHLRALQADGLIVTGSETDVCVLATIMGAVDHGYRVILVRDGVCSFLDEGHDALLGLYHRRFSLQIETADAETVLSRWA